MKYTWTIEASESSENKPHYLVRRSRGLCFFLWSDERLYAKKFSSKEIAFEWAKNNHLNCGFRVCYHGDNIA